jgi:hypothetical protein
MCKKKQKCGHFLTDLDSFGQKIVRIFVHNFYDKN